MGGGAAAAAIIAAKQQRVQSVIDAFRLGEATAPDRARRIEDLGVAYYDEANDLISEHVLLPGPREGTYYLSEAGYIARREGRNSRVVIAIIAVVAVLIGIALLSRVAAQ
jgi:hypothetical protein